MVSTTRMEMRLSDRAKSLAKLTTCDPLTPVAGSISYRVMTGPGAAATTRTSTPKSFRRFSIMRLVISSVSGATPSCRKVRLSSKSTCGNLLSGNSLNKGFWRSFTTRSLRGTAVTGASMTMGATGSAKTGADTPAAANKGFSSNSFPKGCS